MSSDQAATIVARALARWPELSRHGTPGFSLPVDDDAHGHGEIDRAAEFYLTRACASGNRAAIQAFETEFFTEVRACHARVRPHALGCDELEQRIRERLFVNGAIDRYSGKGDLRSWLRVLATRMIVDHIRSSHPEVPLEDQLLPDLGGVGADVTIAKAQLRTAIRIALRHAFATLTDRQKLLVRSELQGTALSAIAGTYQVHLRSIQRWVREAHEVLLAEFRRVLAQRLRATPADLSSVLTFARSQLLSELGGLVRDGDTAEAGAPY